jgi:hypothetical protein
MDIFKPTYIYVKTCNHCDLKYIGKSTKKTRKQVEKYSGSGDYWLIHLKKYNSSFKTDILRYFNQDEKYECIYFCTQFSKENNIVKSKKWANLKIENGLDGGGIKGRKLSKEHKKNIGNGNRGKKRNKELKKKLSEIHKGRTAWNTGLKIKKNGSLCKYETKTGTRYRFKYIINGRNFSKSFKTRIEAEIAQKIYIGSYKILEELL